MRELQTNSHCRNLILYHLIFVCKYRRKCFLNQEFAEQVQEYLERQGGHKLEKSI